LGGLGSKGKNIIIFEKYTDRPIFHARPEEHQSIQPIQDHQLPTGFRHEPGAAGSGLSG
jgi:hypothetical protein